MPRVADQSELELVFPWNDWEAQLLDSPTRALVFTPDDFPGLTPANFRDRAKRAFAHLGIRTSIRKSEVVVIHDA